MILHKDFPVVLVLFFFLKYILHINVIFVFFQLCFSSFWKRQTWVNVQFALNKNCALEVYGVFAVYHLGFSSKKFQSCNKSLINQACSGPSWENIGPWSFLYCQYLRPIFSQYGPRAWLTRYICYLPGGRSVWEKTVPEVLSTARGPRPRAVLETKGTVFPHTDWPSPVNNIFIFFLQ